MPEKERFLIEKGWQEVPGEGGGTAWKVDVAGTPHYFDLEAAYALETSGAGRWPILGEEALTGLLQATDEAHVEATETKYYQEHGVHRGNYPNF